MRSASQVSNGEEESQLDTFSLVCDEAEEDVADEAAGRKDGRGHRRPPLVLADQVQLELAGTRRCQRH